MGRKMGLAGRPRLGFSLSLLLYSLAEKKIERGKRRRGLGKDFAHRDNFPGLAKLSLIPQNRSGHAVEVEFKLI